MKPAEAKLASPASLGRIAAALAEARALPFTAAEDGKGYRVEVPAREAQALADAMRAERQRARALVLTLHRDPDPSPPSDADGVWVLHSFDRDHAGSRGALRRSGVKKPDEVPEREPSECFTEAGHPLPWLRSKLRVGLAWALSMHEHGLSEWCIEEVWEPEDGQPDGLLVWEEPADHMGAKTKEARLKDAGAFLAEWNAWMNGEVYGFGLDDENGDEVEPFCGGFTAASASGADSDSHLAESIREAVKRAGEGAFIARVTGDAADVADYLGLEVGRPEAAAPPTGGA